VLEEIKQRAARHLVKLNILEHRKQMYVRTFKSPTGEAVLADLARFCRSNKSTFHVDPRVSAVLQGRHEVFLRITQHLGLTPEQLLNLYDGADK